MYIFVLGKRITLSQAKTQHEIWEATANLTSFFLARLCSLSLHAYLSFGSNRRAAVKSSIAFKYFPRLCRTIPLRIQAFLKSGSIRIALRIGTVVSPIPCVRILLSNTRQHNNWNMPMFYLPLTSHVCL